MNPLVLGSLFPKKYGFERLGIPFLLKNINKCFACLNLLALSFLSCLGWSCNVPVKSQSLLEDMFSHFVVPVEFTIIVFLHFLEISLSLLGNKSDSSE